MWGLLFSFITFVVLSAPSVWYIWNYPSAVRMTAFWKALFLWLVSTSPVICGILLSKPKFVDKSIAIQFQLEAFSSFTISEMFVYSAAFLSPVLYVVFDIVKQHADGEIRLRGKDISKELRGMQGVFYSSVVILILTLMAYSSAKTDPSGFSETYLALFLTNKGYIIYFVSLLIWYSVMLWEATPQDNFERDQKVQSGDFSDKYAERRGAGA